MQSNKISKLETALSSLVDTLNEIKAEVSTILSHTEGKASFSRGLVMMGEELAVVNERLDNTIEKIDKLSNSHEQRLCMAWDGVTNRRAPRD